MHLLFLIDRDGSPDLKESNIDTFIKNVSNICDDFFKENKDNYDPSNVQQKHG